jgi:hypothetical protein
MRCPSLLAQQNGGKHRARPSRFAHVRAASRTRETCLHTSLLPSSVPPIAPIESSIDSAHSSGKYPNRWTWPASLRENTSAKNPCRATIAPSKIQTFTDMPWVFNTIETRTRDRPRSVQTFTHCICSRFTNQGQVSVCPPNQNSKC